MRKILMATVGLIGMSAIAAQPALADRAPTESERTAIELALKELGFVRWKEIELDDNRWEIDDAVHSDGKEYDLELEPGSLKVLKRELDD